MHLETIYDKTIRNKNFVIEKNNVLKNELHNFRKISFESIAIRYILEFRLKSYSQIRKNLKY